MHFLLFLAPLENKPDIADIGSPRSIYYAPSVVDARSIIDRTNRSVARISRMPRHDQIVLEVGYLEKSKQHLDAKPHYHWELPGWDLAKFDTLAVALGVRPSFNSQAKLSFLEKDPKISTGIRLSRYWNLNAGFHFSGPVEASDRQAYRLLRKRVLRGDFVVAGTSRANVPLPPA